MEVVHRTDGNVSQSDKVIVVPSLVEGQRRVSLTQNQLEGTAGSLAIGGGDTIGVMNEHSESG